MQIVTRDGSLTFRRAILKANSDMVQISDRFHIIQSLLKWLYVPHFNIEHKILGYE
ncbi:hypothetical protein DX932_19895 [Bacillus cereus]|uniref:Transposase IS204/IS1001/IS1096/IS1165 DDE domain-containing protein n=1 Tax=Bacillus cereus TaxID=1396 RepID=A0A9W7UQB5_BACCE|nr:hypothetical protein DX932_19895 [Bacillus cereus]KAB2500365.1 hypothetical protein F8156_20960 [Bacillus cereus]